MDRVDWKLISEFDGFSTGLSIVEWFEKVERVCKLFRIKESALVIPLRWLTEGAYAIYQQLKNKADMDEIEYAFYTTFSMDESIT